MIISSVIVFDGLKMIFERGTKKRELREERAKREESTKRRESKERMKNWILTCMSFECAFSVSHTKI